MATIYKLENGKYRVQILHEKKRYSATFPTKRECTEWMVLKTNELSKPRSEIKTLKEMLEEYMERVSVKKEGERKECERINRFIREEHKLCSKLIGAVTTADIADWRDRRLQDINPQTGKKITNNTVIREMSWLSNAFRIATYEWQWLSVNPMQEMSRPPKGQPRDRLITEREIETMLFGLDYQEDIPINKVSQYVAAAFILSLETGLRAQELAFLEWGDIDGRVLSVQNRSKTYAGYRKVPLSSRAMLLLAQLDETRKNDSVFNLTTAQLDSNFRRARARVGLKGFTFHDARANATTALAKKLDILDLAKVIGHKDLKTLMVYYRETADKMVDRLD